MKKKRLGKIIVSSIIVIIAAVAGFSLYRSNMMNQYADMTFDEMLAVTTKDNPDAVITVGIIENGYATYEVYGNNSTILAKEDNIFEIGSITKTFTTALLNKVIDEGKIKRDDTIDQYLYLENKTYYPTVKRLMTHTSGYDAYYFETPMIENFLLGKNDFHGINESMLLTTLNDIDLEDKDYDFNYSNYGMAILGLVLESIYDEDYANLMNNFIKNDLKLDHTYVSNGEGNLDNYWEWANNDVYLPAGGLVSNITDMLRYLAFQMNEEHDALTQVSATTEENAKLNIRIDAVSDGWMIDEENHIIWHNGATGHYNSYIGFDKDNKIGVVVLSNLPPDYKIPSTLMGVKILTNLQMKH